MAELLRVPEVAAGATEVIFSEWLVAAGEDVNAGDAIAVVETDKATVEVEAESAGALIKHLVEAGKQVEVGTPMALLGTVDEKGQDPQELLAQLGASVPRVSEAPPRRVVEEPGSSTVATGERLFISPIARKLLREAGVSPHEVVGTGPRGRIRRRDVDAVLAARAKPINLPAEVAYPAEPPAVSVSQDAVLVVDNATEVPHSRVRQTIARRLVTSKREIPHFYVRRTVVVDGLLALRAELNERQPVRLSVNDFVLRAVALAHQQVPGANVVWTDTAMRTYRHVDIAVAVDSQRGLVTPVLRNVETMTLGGISTAVKEYVARANDGGLAPADFEGGTITVTNLGMFGVEEFAAIINPPHSSILAVGAAQPVARVIGGEITVATAMNLVLSADHRAIDGALAARWMQTLIGLLAQPMSLLV